MSTASPVDPIAIGAPVPPKTPDLMPTDEMTEAARVAIAARFPAFEQLRRHEQFRIAHMALAAGLSVPDAPRFARALALLVLLALGGACGRRPTAPVERACRTVETKLPILNPAGDTVAFNTVRTRLCTEP